MKTKITHIATWLAALAMALTLTAATRAATPRVSLRTSLGTPTMLAGQKQTTYLKVALRGFPLERTMERTPVNLAIVLDKSGSMGGEKIARAREAAIMALDRLDSRDIVSVVVYDSSARVIVPATKLTDKDAVYRQIRGIQAGGSTALFAGVSKGAAEIRKFFSEDRANSIILLSDGLANVGPQSPGELGQLGESLGREGVTVSTIGLGLSYNEDLMTKLAMKSDGNHFFAHQASELASVFDREFGKAMSVVAQNVTITIECAPGVRPVRILGREAQIAGQKAVVTINHLYSDYQKHLIMEVEVPEAPEGDSREVARVDVDYRNMATGREDRLASRVAAHFTNSASEIDRKTDAEVMADAVEMIAVANSRMAIALRDQGKVEEARKAFISNQTYLYENASKYNSKKLKTFSDEQMLNSQNLEGEQWQYQRKATSEGDVWRVKQ